MKIRELIEKLQEVEDKEATAVVWSWFESGERIYRVEYPTFPPFYSSQDNGKVLSQKGERCQIVGCFDDCLAYRVTRK